MDNEIQSYGNSISKEFSGQNLKEILLRNTPDENQRKKFEFLFGKALNEEVFRKLRKRVIGCLKYSIEEVERNEQPIVEVKKEEMLGKCKEVKSDTSASEAKLDFLRKQQLRPILLEKNRFKNLDSFNKAIDAIHDKNIKELDFIDIDCMGKKVPVKELLVSHIYEEEENEEKKMEMIVKSLKDRINKENIKRRQIEEFNKYIENKLKSNKENLHNLDMYLTSAESTMDMDEIIDSVRYRTKNEL